MRPPVPFGRIPDVFTVKEALRFLRPLPTHTYRAVARRVIAYIVQAPTVSLFALSPTRRCPAFSILAAERAERSRYSLDCVSRPIRTLTNTQRFGSVR
jgi:hypothetical protein